MLYLVITFGRSPKQRALKVGYTGDVNNRKFSYREHNPFSEWICQRPGGVIEETKIHMYLKSYGLKKNFLKEWFEDSQETRQRFHAPFETINRRIWEYRNLLFSESDFKTTESTKRKIYEELRMIYGVGKNEKPIDRVWKIDFNKKVLNSVKTSFPYL